MTPWIVVLAVGLGSYLFRISMITVTDRLRMPARIDRAAELVAPAAFAALAATSVANVTLGIPIGQALPPLAAALAGIVAAARTGSPNAAMLAGMPTLWLVSAAV